MSADTIPGAILDRLRGICLALPDAFEEAAWTGIRWKVRTKTFAHVVIVDAGWPPAYATALRGDGRRTVVTFQTRDAEGFKHADPSAGLPQHTSTPPRQRIHYFGFGRDTVGATIDEQSDWTQISEWITDSYLMLAPKKLVARVRNAPDQ